MIERIDFKRYSSIKIGQVEQVLIINSINDALEQVAIIGGANNVIISPNPPKLAMLSKEYDYIKEDEECIYVGAKTRSGNILSYAKKHNLANFEFLYKLPGTLGGMVKMNAGLKNNEIFDNIVKVKTQNGYIAKENIKHSYRKTDIKGVIFEAVFKKQLGFKKELLTTFSNLRSNQPTQASAGSCFKNPPTQYAAKLLEEVNIKGLKINNVGFSEKHSNFLVNYGDGRYEDCMKLIAIAKKRVYDTFGIKLELEILVL